MLGRGSPAGNALTRIGVIALFFGVGFLLKYLAEIITIPIEVKLAGVALVGAVLVLLGVRLARTRPGYGLSLEGAGAGILYLTTFAALRLYDVLPPVPAFALLVAHCGADGVARDPRGFAAARRPRDRRRLPRAVPRVDARPASPRCCSATSSC